VGQPAAEPIASQKPDPNPNRMTRIHLSPMAAPLRRLALLVCTALLLSACGGSNDSVGDSATSLASDGTLPTAAESLQSQAKGAELNAQDLVEARLEAESIPSDSPLSTHLPASMAAFQSGQVAQKAIATLLPVYRFFNTQTGTHFYTTSTSERDSVIANLPQFRFEGEAFKAASGPSAGLKPVYRFFNTQNGVHFYTISESERDFIQANLPQYRLEGVAYHASMVAGAGLSPLYRFFLPRAGTHFYTASEAERQQVQDALSSTYTFEGVGYYVLGSGFSFGPSFAQQAYIKAANAEALDDFGYSVAISGDTMVVGANYEASNQTTITNGSNASPDNSASLSGAVYIYTRSGNTWVQQAYLKAPNAEAGDQFGTSVAISGDTIVVGAQYEDSNQTTITNGSSASTDNSTGSAGAAYVYVRSGSTWNQQAYLKAPNAETGDHFGHSVAISGDTIVVGSHYEGSSQTNITNGSTASADNSAQSAGAAYVFARSGSTWSQQAYLKAPNAEWEDRFGFSVGISGDTIVVGAPFEDSSQTTITNGPTASANNSAENAGAAYVFTRSGTIWSQQAYLKAPNAEVFDNFGYSVAISDNTIVVGARNESSNQTTITNGSSASTNNSAGGAGAGYVFTRSGGIWSQQAYLKASNAEANDTFGSVVAISGDTIVVSAHQEDSSQATITNCSTASANNDATNAGAGYVFVRDGSTWRQQAYLKASNAGANDLFGRNVAVSSDTIVVSAEGEDSNQTTITNGNTASADNTAVNAGAAYVFTSGD
jgi:hypothetical protein